MIAVFARPNHPAGYGMPRWANDPPGQRAHGYVVALVHCRSRSELEAVQAILGREPGLPEPFGHTWHWYGGPLDLIACLAGETALSLGSHPRQAAALQPPGRLSIGDNRYVGFYEVEELLDRGGGGA